MLKKLSSLLTLTLCACAFVIAEDNQEEVYFPTQEQTSEALSCEECGGENKLPEETTISLLACKDCDCK